MTLRIGVHPNNLHLLLAQHWPGAFRGLDVKFVPYPEGRDTGRLISENAFDIGGTGSTPPIISQVAGINVRYVAASVPRPANGAILIRKGSSIKQVSDLSGRKIALLDGSFHTYLLARVLEGEAKRLKDVSRVELSPEPSRVALAAGDVDAWIAMAPHLAEALASGEFEQLVACGATIPNRSVFWTISERGLSASSVRAATAGLIDLGQQIGNNLDTAARILSDLKIGGAGFATWRQAVAGRDWHIVAASSEILAEQRDEADTLYRHGELKSSIMPVAAVTAAGETVEAGVAR
jgi:ABC-type phosphate/phosphonate transport system substrate-binding protein